jgi:hypothetical protein
MLHSGWCMHHPPNFPQLQCGNVVISFGSCALDLASRTVILRPRTTHRTLSRADAGLRLMDCVVRCPYQFEMNIPLRNIFIPLKPAQLLNHIHDFDRPSFSLSTFFFAGTGSENSDPPDSKPADPLIRRARASGYPSSSVAETGGQITRK